MIQAEIITLFEAFLNQNDAVRVTAEQRFRAIESENLVGLMLTCANIFQDNEIMNNPIRVMAGIHLKNTVRGLSEKDQWNRLDLQIRHEIKDKTLKTLAEPNRHVRIQAAQIIGIIYVAELPLNEPDQILPVFTQGALNPDPEVKKPAIMALEALTNEFKVKGIKPTKEVANQMLTGIFSGLNDNRGVDINILGVEALTSFISFAEELLDKTTVHQEILASLSKLGTREDEELTENIVEFLLEFIERYYNLAKDFAPEIWKLTSNCIANGPARAPAVKIWLKIATQEHKDAEEATMIPQVEKLLVPLLIAKLTDEANFEDEEYEGESEFIANSKECLTLFALRPNTALKEQVLNALDYLYSGNPIEIRASLFLYSCLVGQSPELQDVQNITRILELTDSLNTRVRQEAGQALAKIAKTSPQIFLQESLLSVLLQLIGADLKPQEEETQFIKSSVYVDILQVWQHLANYIIQNKIEFNFESIIATLLRNLISAPERLSSSISRESSFTLQEIFKGIQEDQAKMDQISRILLEVKNKEKNFKKEMQEFPSCSEILCCIQCLLYNLQFSNTQNPNSKMSFLHEILNIVHQFFPTNKCQDTAIMNLLRAVISVKPVFIDISEQIWPYFSEAINNYEDQGPFMAALKTLDEIALSGLDTTASYVPKILSLYNDILLESNDCDKQLKAKILSSLGNIVLGYQGNILSCVEKFNQIYTSAIAVAIQPKMETEDEENKEDLKDVKAKKNEDENSEYRESLLESYSNFFKTLVVHSNNKDHWSLLPKVLNFIKLTSGGNFKPSKEQLKNSVYFLRYVTNVCKGTSIEQDARELIENLIGILKQNGQNFDLESIIMKDSTQSH